VKFTREWGRVRCLDAEADLEVLEGLEQEIDVRLRNGASTDGSKSLVEVFADSLSNSVQMTEGRACLAESVPAEMDLLMRMYVEPMKVAKTRMKSGRAAIAGNMRTEFERAGVWSAMNKRIAAARYTAPGDPLKIDCGYRASAKTIRMFQAVSLENDVSLRAVSEEEDEASERYRFGVETMERQAIRVVTVNDLARAAETARRELGM
jgi:hypothetical protein